ncbi:MAG: alginate export family protein [Gammaproteobacteria bacterium]
MTFKLKSWLWLLSLCMGVSQCEFILANEKNNDNGSNGIEFYFDDPPQAKHIIADHLKFGADLEIQYEYFEDLDLNQTEDDQVELFQPMTNLVFTYEPLSWLSAYTELSLQDDFFINKANSSKTDKNAQALIKQAYVTLSNPWNDLSFQIGRQRFRDEREWWYDENLDALHLFYRFQRWGINASVSRQQFFESDLLDAETEAAIDNYLFVLHYAAGKKTDISGYFLYRNDLTDRQRDKLYVGLQSTGNIAAFKYWLDSAVLLGSNKDKQFRAYAFDMGLKYQSHLPLNPSLAFGVAHGSGDTDKNDNIDGTFRQTGLEDNNSKLNGVTRFKYYGELLEPELSNLWILTSAAGVKPTKRTSVEVIYHYYRQHQLDDNFRSKLNVDPNEKSKDLGHELDFVVGIRDIENLNIELVLGTFFPGSAFSKWSDNSYYGKVEMAYRY